MKQNRYRSIDRIFDPRLVERFDFEKFKRCGVNPHSTALASLRIWAKTPNHGLLDFYLAPIIATD